MCGPDSNLSTMPLIARAKETLIKPTLNRNYQLLKTQKKVHRKQWYHIHTRFLHLIVNLINKNRKKNKQTNKWRIFSISDPFEHREFIPDLDEIKIN